MCIYCNKIVNTDLKEINESYIEDIICETDYMGIYRKFTISKYDNYDYPCLSCSHVDIMYCHNCIHYLGRYHKKI